ncbi:interleukin 15, like isoform 2-T2 [Symphorus nematophorus]
MLRGKPVLASVHLCFICLLAVMPQPAARRCSLDIVTKVQTVFDDAGLNGLDCRLYTPPIQHFQKCPSSTMKCFADEIKVLIEEWENFPYHHFKLDLKLKILSSKLNQTESECHQCELFTEKTAGEFLNDLLKTLEKMNSVNCPREKKRLSSS